MRRLKSGRPAPPRERRPTPARTRIVRGCLPLFIPVLAAALIHDSLARHAADAGLSVQSVMVAGRDRTDRQTLIDALGVEIGDPVLSLDLAVARERVAALPWVRDVAIRRDFPATVIVTLTERDPLALWQNEGAVSVIDAGGDVIDGARPAGFADLLLVVGPDAPGHAAELLAAMDLVPTLRERVAAAVRVGGRRWNLRLDDGIDIQLPESDWEGAWLALAALDRAERLLARDIRTIDLRLPDRLVVRLTPDARSRAISDSEGEDT